MPELSGCETSALTRLGARSAGEILESLPHQDPLYSVSPFVNAERYLGTPGLPAEPSTHIVLEQRDWGGTLPVGGRDFFSVEPNQSLRGE
jgi:hypothetical protein